MFEKEPINVYRATNKNAIIVRLVGIKINEYVRYHQCQLYVL